MRLPIHTSDVCGFVALLSKINEVSSSNVTLNYIYNYLTGISWVFYSCVGYRNTNMKDDRHNIYIYIETTAKDSQIFFADNRLCCWRPVGQETISRCRSNSPRPRLRSYTCIFIYAIGYFFPSVSNDPNCAVTLMRSSNY